MNRSVIRKAASFAGHRARELALWPRVLSRSDKPKVVFLPSSGREGSGLLRAFLIAEALNTSGWNAITLPAQLEQVQRARLLRTFNPDLLVFQQCRHHLNDPDLTSGYRHVLDIDDADFHDPAATDVITRTCQTAAGVIAGSRYIRDWCRQHSSKVKVVWTGTPVTGGARPDHQTRAPIVSWAQSSPLGYPMELAFITELDARLRAKGLDYILRLYGVNTPAERESLRARFGAGAKLELLPLMRYDAFLTSLQEVAIGLSPIIPQSVFSRGKSFGKILGYLDAGVPVIASDEADHALFFTAGTGIVSNEIAIWEEAIARLLADPSARNDMARQATSAMQERLSTQAAAAQVDHFLKSLL